MLWLIENQTPSKRFRLLFIFSDTNRRSVCGILRQGLSVNNGLLMGVLNGGCYWTNQYLELYRNFKPLEDLEEMMFDQNPLEILLEQTVGLSAQSLLWYRQSGSYGGTKLMTINYGRSDGRYRQLLAEFDEDRRPIPGKCYIEPPMNYKFLIQSCRLISSNLV